MTNYLLDTNVCVDWMPGKNRLLAQRIHSHPFSKLATCSIVLAELHYGAARSADPSANSQLIHNLLGRLTSYPFDDAAAEVYGPIRQSPTSAGLVIGANDQLIAAIVIQRQCILVTRNTSEFSRVAGLVVENWDD